MAEDWTFDITQVKTTEIKAPLGFNSSEINVEDSKARRQEINRMKENKAWGLVKRSKADLKGPIISSFFIGTNISMFTIGIYSYNIYNSINTLLNINKTFKPYESPEYSLFTFKVLYFILGFIQLILIGYKINKMGFLPMNAADWASFAFEPIKERDILNLNFR